MTTYEQVHQLGMVVHTCKVRLVEGTSLRRTEPKGRFQGRTPRLAWWNLPLIPALWEPWGRRTTSSSLAWTAWLLGETVSKIFFHILKRRRKSTKNRLFILENINSLIWACPTHFMLCIPWDALCTLLNTLLHVTACLIKQYMLEHISMLHVFHDCLVFFPDIKHTGLNQLWFLGSLESGWHLADTCDICWQNTQMGKVREAEMPTHFGPPAEGKIMPSVSAGLSMGRPPGWRHVSWQDLNWPHLLLCPLSFCQW